MIYFSSLGIQQRVIVELLRERNFSRTEVAVSGMLQAIQKSTGALKRLAREKVDALVRDLLAGDNMDALLLPTVEDQMIVDRVSRNPHSFYMNDPLTMVRHTRILIFYSIIWSGASAFMILPSRAREIRRWDYHGSGLEEIVTDLELL